jgi:hypothetical protein
MSAVNLLNSERILKQCYWFSETSSIIYSENLILRRNATTTKRHYKTLEQQNPSQTDSKESHLTVALTAANDAPWVVVDDRQVLRSARGEWVVEVVAEGSWLLPSIGGVAEKHAEKMTCTGLAVRATVFATGVHDAQVVDELDVALLTVERGAEALG